MWRQCESAYPDFMRLWEQVVNIDSGSGYMPGLLMLADVLGPKLAEAGFEVRRIPAASPGGQAHLHAVRRGNGTGSILFLAHMDTVFKPGTARERPFRMRDDHVSGPGVADCKAGLVQIVTGLQLLRDFDDFKCLTVLFNCDQELGSPTSRDLIAELAARHDVTLSFEAGEEEDRVVTSRRGSGIIHLKVFGRNSHSGSGLAGGRNALMELIWQVERVVALQDAAKDTDITFTRIQSGERLNVIPNMAEAWADMRAEDPAEFDRVEKALASLVTERRIADCRVSATLSRRRPPFPVNERSETLAALAGDIYSEIGRTLTHGHSAGSCDVNTAWAAGSYCLDCLGPVKIGPNHCPEERVHISSVVPRLYLMVRLVQEICAASHWRRKMQ